MRSNFVNPILFVTVIALIASDAKAILMYAADVQNPTGGTSIVTFDTSNPAGTIHSIGHTGVSDYFISGMDFDSAGTLYGVTQVRGGGEADGSFYTINKSNGLATLVGELNMPVAQQMTDLTYNPANGTFYGCAFDGIDNFLYTIDKSTGNANLIGTINRPGAIFLSICANSSGTIYLQGAFGQMYTLNGLDAIATSSGIGVSTIFPNGMTMDWKHNNEWYLGATFQIGQTLNARGDMRLMNNATGGTQQILGAWPELSGNGYPVYGISDVAIDPMPEPASAAFIAILGAIVLLYRAR